MAITAADVRTRFPGAFDDLDNATLTAIIAEVNLEINETYWGTPDFDVAALYLTAHIASYTTPGGGAASGASGPVTKHRVGDVEVTFGSLGGGASSALSDLSATPYGQRYLQLRRGKQPGIAFVSHGG